MKCLIPNAVHRSRFANFFLIDSITSAPKMLDISFGASNIKPISGKHPCRKYQITLRRLVEITTNSYTERDAAQRTNTRQCADLKIHIHNVVLSIHTIPYIVTDKAHILDWFLNNVQFVVAFLSMC